jgi:O-antigen/teichoic acid export membrane protein
VSKLVASATGLNVRLTALLRQRFHLLGAAGWVTTMFSVQQVLRLGTSVLLARLLAPELLGTMLLINALRTGGELLTDLGIGQSIVKHPRGQEPAFYNTAWTLQIIRGLILFLVALAMTVPLASLYENRELLWMLPVASAMFIINALTSPAAYLLQKRMALRTLAGFNISMALISSLVHILLALYTPTIWALLGGLLISSAISSTVSFFLMDYRTLSLKIDKDARDEIVHFGKWIFISSLIYFSAMNFDRLYFAKAVPLAALGVYGIARSLADAINLLTQRLGNLVVFPKISASRMAIRDLRQQILPLRRIVLVACAAFLALAVAMADQFVFLAYDARYREAASFLPVMLIGTWFSILASFADAMLMGLGKPSNVALANGAKLTTVLVVVPQVLPSGGILAAVWVFAAAEAVRYGALLLQKRSAGIGFSRQDLWATLLFFTLVIFWREATGKLGLTGGLAPWLERLGGALG